MEAGGRVRSLDASRSAGRCAASPSAARTRAWPPTPGSSWPETGNDWAIADDAARSHVSPPALASTSGRKLDRGGPRAVRLPCEPVRAARPAVASVAATGSASPTCTGSRERRACPSSTRATRLCERGTRSSTAIQVPSPAMEELVLARGIGPAKVFRIPIGVDLGRFRPRAAAARPGATGARASRDGVRRRLVPEGRRRLGRGPRAEADQGSRRPARRRRAARERGPGARRSAHRPGPRLRAGGLERLGVPYRHVVAARSRRGRRAYRAIDVCLVASRDEGGPKAVLEAMATGVPLVTTRVGQAADLVGTARTAHRRRRRRRGHRRAAAGVAAAPEAELDASVRCRPGYGGRAPTRRCGPAGRSSYRIRRWGA